MNAVISEKEQIRLCLCCKKVRCDNCAAYKRTGKLKNKRIVESEFYEYYNKGYTDAEIARNIGVPRENVYEYRKRRGLVQHKEKDSDT